MVDPEVDEDGFIDLDTLDDDGSTTDKAPKEEPEVQADDGGIEIEVVDDTPEEDRGKWVADGTEPLPDEDDEVKTYSKRVQKRIAEATARVNAERRRADQLAREAEEAVRAARYLYQENSSLKDIVDRGEQALTNEHMGHLESELKEAQRLYAEAEEAEDAAGKAAAMQKISELAARKVNVQNRAFQPLERIPEEQIIPQQPQRPPEATAQAKEWQDRNQWFGKDEMLTQHAIMHHRRLVAGGMQPDTDEYFEALDSEMRKTFRPERLGIKEPTPNRRRTVASGQRTASGKTRVQLTESMRRIAKKMGVSDEEYAAEMLKLEQRK